MPLVDSEKLYQILTELKVIEQGKLDETLSFSKSQKIPLEQLLLEKDLITDENLGKIIADILNFPFIRLSQISIPDEILQVIPEIVADKQKIIAFQKDKEGLHLAMNDPSNIQIRDFVEKKAGIPVVVFFAMARDINDVLSLYSKDVKQTFADIISENIQKAGAVSGELVEPPIIRIVDTIINYAYQNKASDIHIEPYEDASLVRFRIDGVLHDIVKLPLDLHQSIVTRIKVMARLRTDEHQAAQDGKIVYKTDASAEAEELDLRVSIIPIIAGEKIVMRLLSERSRQFSLHDLGFSDKDFIMTQQAYQKPYGMILSTGPTGSGKTTTMYAVLKLLNKRDVNIMTIEDPVEYEIEGINQIQVNSKTNLTFAAGLRSIVRQDPNIILVGEIRDDETAGIAINSAMTGHLVLSTLHTNDAATSIPRLLDMGIEPFLVSSTVNVIIAQRLVRKICLKCRVSKESEPEEFRKNFSEELMKKYFSGNEKTRIYSGKGCPVCHQTGYEGRIGIFEVLLIDDEIRQAITERSDAGVIKKIAVKSGMTTMIDDGIEKVKQGVTTLEEIMRVTKE